jgi:hypothetical protein
MPSINPGPASTSTASTVAVLTPQNILGSTVPGQGGNALRLIAVGRSVPLGGTGDIALLPIINASSWTVVTFVFTNALVNGVTGSVAAASLAGWSAAAGGGTALRTAGVLTGLTGSTVVLVNAAAAAGAALNFQTQNIFVNNTVAVAGGTVDIFVYGYDLS